MGVDDRYAGVGHHSPQRAHRAGFEQILDLLPRIPHIGEPPQIAADLLALSLLPRGQRRSPRSAPSAGSPDQQ